MATVGFLSKTEFSARALLLGERIDLRALETTERLAANPLTVAVQGGGMAVLFRYGVVVLFDVAPLEEAAFLAHLKAYVLNAFPKPETEILKLRIDPEMRDTMQGDTVFVDSAATERLQIIADILAKSVILSLYESRISQNFDRVEPLSLALAQAGRAGRPAKELLQHIGNALLSEHMMVGRVEVGEKPEILWEFPELEKLYLRLESEFELRERHLALERKLNLISRTAETLLKLLHNNRSLRVEWYIVILIVAEIMLTLYEMFMRAQ
jgi:uncharacterized Rmd1/YagE family protein